MSHLGHVISSSSTFFRVVLYADEVEREHEQKRKDGKGKKKSKKLEVKKGADEENLPAIGVYSDFLTYEEVVLELPKATHRRPIVLCGAEGVGCLKLRDRLLESDRITLACPVPCKFSCSESSGIRLIQTLRVRQKKASLTEFITTLSRNKSSTKKPKMESLWSLVNTKSTGMELRRRMWWL